MSRRRIVIGLLLASQLSAAAALRSAAEPNAGGGPEIRAASPSPQRTQRLVFSCRESTVVVFSDRPCSPAAERRTLEVVTPPAPGRPPTTAPAPSPATIRVVARDDKPVVDEHAETCRRLEAAVEKVDDRMRTGYSAREAPRLWQQWRDAKDRVREAHC
jgi:hypothetical protein